MRIVAAAALSTLVAALACACAGVTARNDDAITVKTVVVNGAELSYVEQGHGEAVVFMHSLVADYTVWDGIRRRFPPDFRFVTYSRRHHTPNAWPDDGASHTLGQHVDDLAAFIRSLGVGRAHVVALGIGARVAAHAAIEHPDVIGTLTVGDGALARPTTDDGRRALEAFSEAFVPVPERIDAHDEAGTAAAVIDWLRPERGGWSALPPKLRVPYLDNARTLFLVRRDGTLRAPACEALAALRMPVLVLAGDETPPGLRATNEAVRNCLPGAEYAPVPRAGHLWYEDNPDEALSRLLAFLGRHRE